MVDRIPAFQPDDPGSVLGWIGDFNLYPGNVSLSFDCALSYAISGGDPDIMLTTDSGGRVLLLLSSVLVHSLALPTGIVPRAFRV